MTTPTDDERPVPSQAAPTLEQFIAALGAYGWRAHADAQHERIAELHRHLFATPQPAAPAQGLTDMEDSGPLLDDEGRAMVGASHHYTAENIRALIADLKAIESGDEFPELVNRDHGTRAGIIWRIISGLCCDVPLAATPTVAQPATNPYASGSMREGWQRGYEGRPMLAASGSDYAKAYAEGKRATRSEIIAAASAASAIGMQWPEGKQ